MDFSVLRALGYGAPSGGESTYSSGGLSLNLAQPFNQSGGIVRRGAELGNSPGDVDPQLAAELQMGGRGGYARGASALLGAGYNPFTPEFVGDNGGSGMAQNPNQSLDALFDVAQQVGLDTSKYSRDLGTPDIRGNRSGNMDAAQLYDDLNQYTKDLVSVDHMTPDGRGMERTLYQDQGGKLVPVTGSQRRSSRQDNTFFSDDFKGALSTVGLAALGGWLAAPAAAGGTAAGGAAGGASGAAATGASQVGTNALSSAWSSLPQWGQRALSGALQGGLSSGLQGGNVLQGALTGGVTGAAGSAVSDAASGLDLPKWASGGLSGAVRGGLGAALNGGDVLSGALSGGVSGGLSGAGLPSGLATLGGKILSGALAEDSNQGSSGGTAPAAPAPSGGVIAALGGSNGGSGGGSTPLYDPNAARARSALASALLNRRGRAGDTRADQQTALSKALAELG